MQLYHLNSATNIIRVTGTRSIICAGHVSCIRDTTTIINFVLKCEGGKNICVYMFTVKHEI
jgi:hypothetical protein